MDKLAQARIIAWQGGSLWLLQTAAPVAGVMPRTGFHAHHAIQIVIDLGGHFVLSLTEDDRMSAPFLAVAADTPHRLEASGAYALLFVEPESRAGRAIADAIFGDGPLCALPETRFQNLQPQLAALARCPAPPADDLLQIGRDLAEGLATGQPAAAVDPRIKAVLRWIAQPDQSKLSLQAAARVAGLSPSRLSHLFVEQTGLSLKTYLLWNRLSRAVHLMTDGLPLTAIAHQTGFSDSAHFSRTFRRMFGVAPANLKLL